MRMIAGVLAVLAAAFLGLCGLFLILYRGEAGSEEDVQVGIGGTDVDADLVGAGLLALAFALTVLAGRFIGRH